MINAETTIESDAVRLRAAAAAKLNYPTDVAAYYATNEQGNFALWCNVFTAARGRQEIAPGSYDLMCRASGVN